MPETDLQKHAVIESFLQPNFSSKIWHILLTSNNLAYLYTALLEYEKKSLGKSF